MLCRVPFLAAPATRRTAVRALGPAGAVRGMATLKDMKNRIKAVSNMAKITKSMKMVAAAKLKRAEKAMEAAIPLGKVSGRLQMLLGAPEKFQKRLVVCITADRGLCGAINTNVAKEVKSIVAKDEAAGRETSIVLLGDKGRAALQRQYGKNFTLSFNDFGKQNFSYSQAAFVVDRIVNSDLKYDVVTVVANEYKNIVTYSTVSHDFASAEIMGQQVSALLPHYDVDSLGTTDDIWAHYLANTIFRCVRESTTVEQAQRMSAMESASKNAKEMVAKLTLTYNRTRQAVITKELIEIISGAAAL